MKTIHRGRLLLLLVAAPALRPNPTEAANAAKFRAGTQARARGLVLPNTPSTAANNDVEETSELSFEEQAAQTKQRAADNRKQFGYESSTAPRTDNSGLSFEEQAAQTKQRAADNRKQFGYASSNTLPEINAGKSANDDEEKDSPVFGEEGFGGIETKRGGGGAVKDREEKKADTGSMENQRASVFNQRIQELRRQGARAGEEEKEGEEDAQELAQQVSQQAVSMALQKVCLAFPPLFLIWFNVKMVYGSWIKKGKALMIGPFTWNDVLLFGPKPGASPNQKVPFLPEKLLHVILVFIDLLLVMAVFVNLIFLGIILYALYLFATDPLGALKTFGSILLGTIF